MGQKLNFMGSHGWKQQIFKYVGGGSVKESNSVVGGYKKVSPPPPPTFLMEQT